jgi:signal transduction histidine kinase
LEALSPGIIGRWPLAWLAGLVLPSAWYLLMLWHTGFWASGPRGWGHILHRVGAAVVLAAVLGSVVLYALYPISLVKPASPNYFFAGPAVGGIYVLAIAYAAYLVLLMALSVLTLWHPAPHYRAMGELARRRARPWLAAASGLLLLVSLLFAGCLLWFARSYYPRSLPAGDPQWLLIGGADFAISLLVAAALLCIGQAIVAYEIFTGKTLPRQGLARNWRNVLALAVALCAALSLGLVLEIPAVYVTIVAALIPAGFFAVYTWRSFREQERAMLRVRPFIAPGEAGTALRALCGDVLGAARAALLPLGGNAALVAPVAFPDAPPAPPDVLPTSPATLFLPLDTGGYAWAVPLWNEHGLAGVLLLGEKRGGGLYTHEEMEIARAGGERLLATWAGAELTRRLIVLQRTREAETRVADRRTRRAIHDDVLPRVHTLMLALAAHSGDGDAVAQLAELHKALSDLLRDMPAATGKGPGVFEPLRAAVADEFAGAFDGITWQIDPAVEALDAQLHPLVAEVAFGAAREAVRNAARHARGGDDARPLHLAISAVAECGIRLVIADNGVGGELPVQPGHGTFLHSTMLAVVGGAWCRVGDAGTRVTLDFPVQPPGEGIAP